MIAFRSLLIPLQAAITNLLSAAAAFGVLTAAFQWGWGISLLGIDTDSGTVPIASYVPLMMFAVLFGLSMDYEVFLRQPDRSSTTTPARTPGRPSRSGVASSARITAAAPDHDVGVRQLHPQRRPDHQAVRRRASSVAVLLAGTMVLSLGAGHADPVRQGGLVAARAGCRSCSRTSTSRANPRPDRLPEPAPQPQRPAPVPGTATPDTDGPVA